MSELLFSRSSEVHARRAALLNWIRERPEHQGLTSVEIVKASGLYEDMQASQEKCTQDCRMLVKMQLLEHDEASIDRRWCPVKEADETIGPESDALTAEALRQDPGLARQFAETIERLNTRADSSLRFQSLTFVVKLLRSGDIDRAAHAYFYDRDKLQTSGQDIRTLADPVFDSWLYAN